MVTGPAESSHVQGPLPSHCSPVFSLARAIGSYLLYCRPKLRGNSPCWIPPHLLSLRANSPSSFPEGLGQGCSQLNVSVNLPGNSKKSRPCFRRPRWGLRCSGTYLGVMRA